MNPSTRKFLIPFLIVDFLFFMALAMWWFHPHLRPSSGKMVLHVVLRKPESKLTEIDVINDGDNSGSLDAAVDVSWPDADLVDAKGLGSYDQTSTGRRSERFFLSSGHSASMLAPGATSAIGWVKLTDDVPVMAEVESDKAAPQ